MTEYSTSRVGSNAHTFSDKGLKPEVAVFGKMLEQNQNGTKKQVQTDHLLWDI